MNQRLKVEKHIKELSKGKANRICIFGSGEYGIRLYQDLQCKLINVDWFSDNNLKKWGYLFDNIYCIPPRQLEEDKDRTLVIVANRKPDEIVSKIKSQGFPYVTTKQEIDRILIDVPPVKRITLVESIENIDYSSKEIMEMINKFNQTIFDICKYYEDRLNS